MSISGTVLVEANDAHKKWIETATVNATAFFSSNPFNMDPSRWDSAAAIDCTGANFVHLLPFVQKTNTTDVVDLDLGVWARYYDGTNGTMLLPILVLRCTWQTLANGLGVPSGVSPFASISGIDTSKAWQLATTVDMSQPSSGSIQELAMNVFGTELLQGASVGGVLQIPCKGWNQLMLKIKQGSITSPAPARFLALYKQR